MKRTLPSAWRCCCALFLRTGGNDSCDFVCVVSERTNELFLCVSETVCPVCGRRCATTSASSAFTLLRAASWWSELWWDSFDSLSACYDEKTSAHRYTKMLPEPGTQMWSRRLGSSSSQQTVLGQLKPGSRMLLVQSHLCWWSI